MSPALARILAVTRAAARALLPLVAVTQALRHVNAADWGRGLERGGALAAGALVLVALWRWRPPAVGRAALPWLAVAAAAGLAVVAPALRGLAHAPRQANDIGWTTAVAVQAVARGGSLYASRIDPQQEVPTRGPGLGFFAGYKYGPLTPTVYEPFLARLGLPGGLYVPNALLLAATAALVAALAWRAGGGAAAALAATALLLFPHFLRFELFWQGVNDLLPAALAMAALLAAAHRRAALAGLALGLSLSAKLLPGGLLLILLPLAVPGWRFAAGLALGLLPYLPHALASPGALFANLVLFNVLRLPDTTGIPGYLSPSVQWVPPLAGALAACLAALAYHRSRRTPADLALASAVALTAFLAGGKVIHRNYLLWWLPVLAAALGAACWRAERAPGPAPGTPG